MTRTHSRLATDLEQSLATLELKPDARAWGQELVNRLRSPVQIVVMGPRHSGKSTVINMLAGGQVIPSLPDVPVVELALGRMEQVVFELSDGTTLRTKGRLAEIDIPEDAVRVRQDLVDANFARYAFTEVNLTGSQIQREAIQEWALDRADVVLWCSENFGADEQLIWSAVPDHLKDHSFLVLTMADRHVMRGTLPQKIADLEELVAEEFMQMFPLAGVQAVTAQTSRDAKRAALWKSSGGKALKDTILARIASGRQADQDNAQMFLSRYKSAVGDVAVVEPEPLSQPEPDAAAVVRRLVSDKDVPLFHKAMSLLQTRADAMLSDVDWDSGTCAERILEHCVEAADALQTLMLEANTQSDLAAELRDDAAESAEMMLLFQLEKSEDAAADAVTLLIQLKSEIAERAVG